MNKHTRKVKTCITYGCTNKSSEGTFCGPLCFPCHDFVVTGNGIYSKVFLNAQRVVVDSIVRKLIK